MTIKQILINRGIKIVEDIIEIEGEESYLIQLFMPNSDYQIKIYCHATEETLKQHGTCPSFVFDDMYFKLMSYIFDKGIEMCKMESEINKTINLN